MEMNEPLHCFVVVDAAPTGHKVAVVHWEKHGFFTQPALDNHNWTDKQRQEFVARANITSFGVTPEIAESAFHGGLSGWDGPEAALALAFADQQHGGIADA